MNTFILQKDFLENINACVEVCLKPVLNYYLMVFNLLIYCLLGNDSI